MAKSEEFSAAGKKSHTECHQKPMLEAKSHSYIGDEEAEHRINRCTKRQSTVKRPEESEFSLVTKKQRWLMIRCALTK